MKTQPYSVRLPDDLRKPLTEMAERDRRTLHSLILMLLDDAVQARRAESTGSGSEASADLHAPMPQAQNASRVVFAG